MIRKIREGNRPVRVFDQKLVDLRDQPFFVVQVLPTYFGKDKPRHAAHLSTAENQKDLPFQ